jgi:hypothetical protein
LFQNLNVRVNTVRFVLSESLTLSNGQLMSTLAGAASAFVAILAGFYTTKIFSISTDKNRLKKEIDSLSLKLQHKREIVKKYEEQRDKEIEEDEDEMINSFISHIDSPTTFILQSLNSFDKVIKYYAIYYRIEGKVSDRGIKKLREKWQPLPEKFKNIKMPSFADPKYNLLNVPYIKSEEQRSREFTRAMEEKKQFTRLLENLRNEQDEVKYLEKQLESNTKDLESIALPMH